MLNMRPCCSWSGIADDIAEMHVIHAGRDLRWQRPDLALRLLQFAAEF